MAQGTARGYPENAGAILTCKSAALGGLAAHALSEQGSDRLYFAAAGPGADHVSVCRPLRGAEEGTLCQGWAHTLQECVPASERQLPGGGDQVLFEDRHKQGGGRPVQGCGGEIVFSTYFLGCHAPRCSTQGSPSAQHMLEHLAAFIVSCYILPMPRLMT